MKRLEEVSKLSSGTTPSRKLEDRYYSNGNINWVKTTDLNNGEINYTQEKITELALNETCLRKYDNGTVLVAMYGGFNQIGRTGLLKITATVNQALIAIQPQRQTLDSTFLINYLNFQVDYWKNVAISSRKDPNITSRDVKNFPIPIPPLPEQKTIAQSLSDVDALIAALEQLITKKHNIKQGTRQQLLTGKKRLPGFSGEWEVKKLGGECELITKGTTPTSLGKRFKNNGINFIKAESLEENGDVIIDKIAFIDYETHSLLKRSQLQENDILVSIAGVLGRTAMVKK